MVVYTPLPPLPPTPDTPYDYLDRRIDLLSTQMNEIMIHFRNSATPGTYVTAAASAPLVSPDDTSPDATNASTRSSTPTRLEPTPDVQGPPPAVAASTAELINGARSPAMRLTYTPRSQASNRRAPVSTPLQQSDFRTSDETRQLHSSLRRDDLYVSGYYWSSPTPILEEHCVAWLDQNLDGPYAGKPDRIAKLSFKLVDDTLASFMQFYTALRAGLNACGFNPHLLPILPRIRHDADLVITPIVDASALIIGTGNDPSTLRTPSVTHWQRAHDSLGMTLYALFQDSIRSSARHAYQALHNGLRLGETNGFAVLHELVRMHHPRVANSLAPSYSSVYNHPPSMQPRRREESYELSHATYSATF
jgi:hypothetical protein